MAHDNARTAELNGGVRRVSGGRGRTDVEVGWVVEKGEPNEGVRRDYGERGRRVICRMGDGGGGGLKGGSLKGRDNQERGLILE